MSNTQLANVNKLKEALNADSVKEQFKNALAENSGLFIASIIDLFNNDKHLQKCDPNKVIVEALKAATLKLPINKQLGFAYIASFKSNKTNIQEPEFIMGYKGYIQLAMRTGQYKTLNEGTVYEGMDVIEDYLTGEIIITGEKTSEKAIGYFCHFELLNGFKKTKYMTVEKVHAHAKRHSKSYHYKNSAWNTDFDSMALKTCIRLLLSKYGIMSVEMVNAFSSDRDREENSLNNEINNKANSEPIDITPPLGEKGQGEGGEKGDPGF